MAQWGDTDTAADSVLWGPTAVSSSGRTKANSANRDLLFGNTTPDADGITVGQYGIDAAEAAELPGASVGWNLRTDLGGGRVRFETLVAMSAISGDADPLGLVTIIVIDTQPANDSVVEPAPGEFSVVASLTVNTNTTLTYQWERQANGIGSFDAIGGATSATYVTPATTVVDNHLDVYRVVVSAGGGSTPVTSAGATLTVTV